MTLPTRESSQQGIFVYRRLEAVAKFLPVVGYRPQPWFPGWSPWQLDPAVSTEELSVATKRMLYVPGIAKWADAFWMERCLVRDVAEEVRSGAPVVLDAHFGYPEGVACYRLAKRLEIPFVVTLRGVEVDWFKHASVRCQMIQALRSAAMVIPVSDSLAELAREAGVCSEKIQVIPNGCDTKLFHPGDRVEARDGLGLDDQGLIFVTVARVHPVKGFEVLMHALQGLADKDQIHFRMLCIGEHSGAYAKKIDRLVDELGLSNRVSMLGTLPPATVASYLRAADLFLLPSHREGCCNAVREALACGTPTVTTDVGDHASLAEKCSSLRVVPPGDSASFRHAIVESIEAMGASTPGACVWNSWTEVGRQCAEILNRCVR